MFKKNEITGGKVRMKLSKAQLEVVDSMKNGLFLFTGEGSNFKAWLGDENGTHVKFLKKKTVEILYHLKVIKIADRFYHRKLYKYELNNNFKG
jgi:hypothetical protein